MIVCGIRGRMSLLVYVCREFAGVVDGAMGCISTSSFVLNKVGSLGNGRSATVQMLLAC